MDGNHWRGAAKFESRLAIVSRRQSGCGTYRELLCFLQSANHDRDTSLKAFVGQNGSAHPRGVAAAGRQQARR